MISLRPLAFHCIFGASVLACTAMRPAAAQQLTREITFELTFQNRDLVWLGDPASPTGLVYPKPGTLPITTDVQVTTRRESHQSPVRQYHRDARIVLDNNVRQVRAFTPQREQLIGEIDDQGRFAPNEFYEANRELLRTWPDDVSTLRYDASENAVYREVAVTGPVITESLDFLPLQLTNATGNTVAGKFSINHQPSLEAKAKSPATVALVLHDGKDAITLAQADVPSTFRRNDVQLGSFDNQAGTYFTESSYRASAIARAAQSLALPSRSPANSRRRSRATARPWSLSPPFCAQIKLSPRRPRSRLTAASTIGAISPASMIRAAIWCRIWNTFQTWICWSSKLRTTISTFICMLA